MKIYCRFIVAVVSVLLLAACDNANPGTSMGPSNGSQRTLPGGNGGRAI
jgi:hypothetical protein